MDGDQTFDELEELQWDQMRLAGASEEEIQRAKNFKQWKEDVYLYTQMIKQRAWEFDRSCTFTGSYLKLCSALEGLTRRQEAINKLHDAHTRRPTDTKITLALAKLLFKDDQKDRSLSLCREIFLMYEIQRNPAPHSSPNSQPDQKFSISEEDAADAYYLGGWVKIHDDDHTEAYKIWLEGHLAVPTSDLLRVQHRKRACWDEKWTGMSEHVSRLVGSAPLIDASNGDITAHYDCFTCHDPAQHQKRKKVHFSDGGETERAFLTPALGIFHPQQEQLGVVFRSKQPVLTAQECSRVIEVVNQYHDALHNGVWGTVRHSSVKTTDVAVESIPLLREWLLAFMHTRMHSMLDSLFPRLADGTTLYQEGRPEQSRIRIHDAFIVRYDAEKDLSLSLPEHCDTSAISVIVSLNSEGAGHYAGGGTWFECLGEKGLVVNAEVGQAVAFAGPLKHAGYPTTKGVRIILVLFLYVEDYHYGPYLSAAKSHCATPMSNNSAGWEDLQDMDGLSEEEKGSGANSPVCMIGTSGNNVYGSNMYGGNGTVFGGVVYGKGAGIAGGDCSPYRNNNNTTSTCTVGEKLASGGEKGGFVVYRQTVDLVNMLDKAIVADEDV